MKTQSNQKKSSRQLLFNYFVEFIEIPFNEMKVGVIIRFVCVTILWLILCYLLLVGRSLNFWTLFVIVCSGIIIFVPLYKKYVRDGNGKKSK